MMMLMRNEPPRTPTPSITFAEIPAAFKLVIEDWFYKLDPGRLSIQSEFKIIISTPNNSKSTSVKNHTTATHLATAYLLATSIAQHTILASDTNRNTANIATKLRAGSHTIFLFSPFPYSSTARARNIILHISKIKSHTVISTSKAIASLRPFFTLASAGDCLEEELKGFGTLIVIGFLISFSTTYKSAPFFTACFYVATVLLLSSYDLSSSIDLGLSTFCFDSNTGMAYAKSISFIQT